MDKCRLSSNVTPILHELQLKHSGSFCPSLLFTRTMHALDLGWALFGIDAAWVPSARLEKRRNWQGWDAWGLHAGHVSSFSMPSVAADDF